MERNLGKLLSHAEYMTCPKCNGNTYGSKEDFFKEYKEGVAKHKKELNEYRERMTVCKQALSKLTREEIRTLRLADLANKLK